MSDEATIYKNDLVTLRLNRRQRRQQVAGNNSEFITGIVQRTGWIQDSDDESEEDSFALEQDEVEVDWVDDIEIETIVKASKLTVVDRSLFVSDIVQKADRKQGEGPYGTVLTAKLSVDIQSMSIPSNLDTPLITKKNVDASSELTRAYKVDVGDVIIHRCFMGQVNEVGYFIELELECSGKIHRFEDVRLKDVEFHETEGRVPTMPVTTYTDVDVGMRLWWPAGSLLQLSLSDESNELSADERQCSHGIVRAFGASHVSVLWLGAPSGMFDTSVVVAGNDSSDEKKSDNSIDVVKPSLTSHDDKEATLNVVGDAATPAVESTPSTSTDATQWPETDVLSLDQVLVVEPPCSAYNFPAMSVVRRKSDHQLFFVTNTRTKVTVLWQDGTEEQNVTSTDLVPVLHLLEQDFFPGDFVRASNVNDPRQETNQAGNNALNVATMSELDKTLDAFLNECPKPSSTTTTTNTNNNNTNNNKNKNNNEIQDEKDDDRGVKTQQSEANQSALLRRHLGVVVKVDSDAQTCDVRWLKEEGGRILERDIPTFTLEAHSQYEELRLDDVVCLMPDHPRLLTGVGMAWAGTVKSVCSDTGGVTVCWADGTESLIDIEELYRVDPEPLLELWDEYYGEEDDDEYEEDEDDSFNSEADYDDDTSLTYRGLVNRLMDSLTGATRRMFGSTSAGDESDADSNEESGDAIAPECVRQLRDDAQRAAREISRDKFALRLTSDLARGGQAAVQAVAGLYCLSNKYVTVQNTPHPLPPLSRFARRFMEARLYVLWLSLDNHGSIEDFYELCQRYISEWDADAATQASDETPKHIDNDKSDTTNTTTNNDNTEEKSAEETSETTTVKPEPVLDDTVAAPAIVSTISTPSPTTDTGTNGSKALLVSEDAPPQISDTLTNIELPSNDEQLPLFAFGSSHHYADRVGAPFTDSMRAMQEWQQLTNGLPARGVFVRVYEQRLDLMKLMIIGPVGSPYEDVPFFFDVAFCNEYPRKPPLVHFHSFVSKLHPNLNEDGNVCLSLLGTWPGESSESWSYPKSCVLQLALSLHALVLGDAEPYYLEAGYERQRGTDVGKRNSKRYTEGALVLVVRHLIAILARLVQDYDYEMRLLRRNNDNDIVQLEENENENDDNSPHGGVFGFRKALRRHVSQRAGALSARLLATSVDANASKGFAQTMQLLLTRLDRVYRAFCERKTQLDTLLEERKKSTK